MAGRPAALARRIDSPLSREGAFLVNNVLFAVFAFVVLLGTVFPLIVEALQDRRSRSAPRTSTGMIVPIGLALLFLMAIAPVLPWRKASTELLRHRLYWPAWCGTGACSSPPRSAPGLAPLLAFGLGGFAAGSALRQLVLATRRQGWRGLRRAGQRRDDRPPRRDHDRRGLAASGSFSKTAQFQLTPGETARFQGHSVTYQGSDGIEAPSGHRQRPRADRRRSVYAPAIQLYKASGQAVGTPSVKTGLARTSTSRSSRSPTPRAGHHQGAVMPLMIWLWIGGGVMALGTILAVFPGRRRRPTDPVSGPSPTSRRGCPTTPIPSRRREPPARLRLRRADG